MFSASDLRKGLKIEIDGQPYVITDFTFTKPGKGQSIYTCKMKNMITGSTMTRQYRSNDKVGKPQLEQVKLQYSYQDGDDYVFMNENYEQVNISAEVLGRQKYFLTEDMTVEILYHNDKPIEVELPIFIEKEITYTEPGARGNTATNVLKPASIDTGYEINVPIFINQGDIVKIDTRTGEYTERVATA
ncbi:MAG: elongation factor P [Verrucomicrobia bacterium]|jgi:elongation factor P|nr:elongation factor P [Verrucomicrobiota bacterium]MBT7701228.1 elongation factor P [Verrucomicrobiota bacterium]